jgi:nicotinamidase-related amidase
MAEQKTEDQQPPIARRGARPFAGPGSASPARPFLRPATPGARPGAAPFAPAVLPSRPALGNARAALPPVQSVAPSPPASTPPALEPPVVPPNVSMPGLGPIAPDVSASLGEPMIPAFDISFGRWGVATPATPTPAQADASAASGSGSLPVASPAIAEDDADMTEPLSPLRARPITSEVVALDAFDAFDAVWGATEQPAELEPFAPATDSARDSAPLDDASLGSGVDAQQLWAEDITAGTTGTPPAVSSVKPPAGRERSTPELAMPAWLADDSDPVPPPGEPLAASEAVAPNADTLGDSAAAGSPPTFGTNFDHHLSPLAAREQSSTLPANVSEVSPQLMASVEMDAPSTRTDDAGSSGSTAEALASGVAGQTDPRLAHGLRVSATLDRLADRVRGGEIDVSSVAPEATDVAVLASVLAALLGGSSSR